jgi:hypothetical protein
MTIIVEKIDGQIANTIQQLFAPNSKNHIEIALVCIEEGFRNLDAATKHCSPSICELRSFVEDLQELLIKYTFHSHRGIE